MSTVTVNNSSEFQSGATRNLVLNSRTCLPPARNDGTKTSTAAMWCGPVRRTATAYCVSVDESIFDCGEPTRVPKSSKTPNLNGMLWHVTGSSLDCTRDDDVTGSSLDCAVAGFVFDSRSIILWGAELSQYPVPGM
eukprot:647039-Rhodomonas_salina.1